MNIKSFILLLTFVSLLNAEDYAFYNQKLSETQSEQAIYLEKHLMATCCFGGPLYGHGQNQMTEDAKITIRRLLIDGKSPDEILDHFRDSIDPRTKAPYGNRILSSPKSTEMVGKVSYWMVVLFIVAGLVILAYALKRLKSVQRDTDDTSQVSDDTLKKVESELSDIE